mgnify:CR=1 FL=1
MKQQEFEHNKDYKYGFTTDIATGIGGSLELDGTNTRPANGTYGYPYIILFDRILLGSPIRVRLTSSSAILFVVGASYFLSTID